MSNIMKKIKSLKELGLLIKNANKTVKIEVKEQKVGFPTMILGRLAAFLLRNLQEKDIRTGQDF